jgi:DNA-binding CsgD family transcriptional regulator
VGSGTLELARARGWGWLVGELSDWRRRAGLESAGSQGAAEPYALQLTGEFATAAEQWRELGCPYEAALAELSSDDEELLRRALAELQLLGARPAAALALSRLRKLGARQLPRGPRPATRSNAAGLSPRQMEVLTLVADGLRNKEIADRLVLSERTVEHHVAAVLRGLGVRTRTEATADAVRRGLVDEVG